MLIANMTTATETSVVFQRRTATVRPWTVVTALASEGVSSEVEDRVRAICLGFPEATEKLTRGAPGFFVRKQFVMLWPRGHHDHEFPHLWCAAEPGAQEALTAASERYFRPPYVGHRGWIGVRLDGDVPWDEVEELLADAYRVIAPPRLAKGG
jgi:predicted DNA-binding protein (MmcQ/YjbR family)